MRLNGAVIIAPLADSPTLVDAIAPEHVEFAIDNPERLGDRVSNLEAMPVPAQPVARRPSRRAMARIMRRASPIPGPRARISLVTSCDGS